MRSTLNMLIVLLVLDLAGLGGLWYGYTIMQEGKEEAITLQKGLDEEEQKGQGVADMRRTLSLAEKDYQLLAPYLYDASEESQIRFISEIEGLGISTTGALVETRTFDLVSGTPKSFHGEFSLTGTWSQLYRFLRLIEEFPGRIVVGRFDVRAANAGTWEGGMTLDLISLKLAP